jgi:uncharacterized alpha-E superfamily protein
VLDGENPNSIRACVTAARENARGIREQISSEMWEHLNRFYLELLEQTAESVLARTPHDLLRWVRSSCWLFDGIAERTMIRGEGWHFLQCGKFLERAESTARLLDGKYYANAVADVGPPGLVDLYQWIALLKSVGAYEAFRKTHGSLQPSAIAAFVLMDARFPSATRYALTRVEAALKRITPTDEQDGANEALRAAGRLLSRLVHARPPEVIAGLHETLTDLVSDCAGLHDAIVRAYFSHLAWRPWDVDDAPEGGHGSPPLHAAAEPGARGRSRVPPRATPPRRNSGACGGTRCDGATPPRRNSGACGGTRCDGAERGEGAMAAMVSAQ